MIKSYEVRELLPGLSMRAVYEGLEQAFDSSEFEVEIRGFPGNYDCEDDEEKFFVSIRRKKIAAVPVSGVFQEAPDVH